jgi:hypothetical protein
MGYYEILLIKLWIWWGWGTLMVFVELVWFWERFDPLPDLLWILGISTWHRDIYRLSMEYCQMLHKHQVKRTCWASHAGTNWLQCCNKRGHLTHAIEVDNRLFFSLFHVYSSPKYIDRTVICHHFGGILLLFFFFWGGLLERFENVCLGCFLWITTCSRPKEVCRECRALQDTFCSVSTELVKQQHFFLRNLALNSSW